MDTEGCFPVSYFFKIFEFNTSHPCWTPTLAPTLMLLRKEAMLVGNISPLSSQETIIIVVVIVIIIMTVFKTLV